MSTWHNPPVISKIYPPCANSAIAGPPRVTRRSERSGRRPPNPMSEVMFRTFRYSSADRNNFSARARILVAARLIADNTSEAVLTLVAEVVKLQISGEFLRSPYYLLNPLPIKIAISPIQQSARTEM